MTYLICVANAVCFMSLRAHLTFALKIYVYQINWPSAVWVLYNSYTESHKHPLMTITTFNLMSRVSLLSIMTTHPYKHQEVKGGPATWPQPVTMCLWRWSSSYLSAWILAGDCCSLAGDIVVITFLGSVVLRPPEPLIIIISSLAPSISTHLLSLCHMLLLLLTTVIRLVIIEHMLLPQRPSSWSILIW